MSVQNESQVLVNRLTLALPSVPPRSKQRVEILIHNLTASAWLVGTTKPPVAAIPARCALGAVDEKTGDALTGLVLTASEHHTGVAGNKLRAVVTLTGSTFTIVVTLPADDPDKPAVITETFPGVLPGGTINLTNSVLVGAYRWVTAETPAAGPYAFIKGWSAPRTAEFIGAEFAYNVAAEHARDFLAEVGG
jgi:hypothetical protein